MSGFALDPLSRGVLTFIADRDTDSPFVTPTDFTLRGQGVPSSGNFRVALADKLAAYDEGDVTWGDTDGVNGFPEAGYLVEET